MNVKIIFAIVVTWAVSTADCWSQPESPPPATALLLESMFSPHCAPPHRTMGLAQRSFLDLAETGPARLEMAIVLDGTDSMGDSLEGVKQSISKMLDDLALYKENQVAFQCVVFLDSGAGTAQEVTFPLNISQNGFTDDRDALREALSGLGTHSGAPYFPELVDLALHQALADLPWSDDEGTARWVILFTDAPPYEGNFSEPETGARRRIATDALVSVANRRRINIHCVLCPSRPQEQAAYEQSLNATRRFMSILSTETDGLLVDLSYNDIRKSLLQTLRTPRPEYERLPEISQRDIEQAQRAAAEQQAQVADGRKARLAVLPHLPLAQMTFDPNRDEVRVAAELRHKLRMLPGAEVKGTASVQRVFTALQGRGLDETQLLQTLANGLDVDYVIWGSLQRISEQSRIVQVDSTIFSRATGERVASKLVRSNLNAQPAESFTGDLALQLVSTAAETNDAPQLAGALRLVTNRPSVRDELIRPVSTNAQARDALLAGFDLLEQALEFPASEGAELLKRARESLHQAVDPAQGDPDNPLAQLLLANCLFNESLACRDNTEQTQQKMREFSLALQKAYRNRQQAAAAVRTEIEADFALLIQRNVAEAIRRYEQLTGVGPEADSNLHAARRAHWMLAGVYAGDWGVDPSVVDAQKARHHLIQILAFWSDSPEARFVRQNLRWNIDEGKTRFPHYPRQSATVTRFIES